MSNTLSFLKNYVKFAFEVRSITSHGYLKLMKNVNEKEAKVYMLRIAEELSASTEDLFYWLTATTLRNNSDKRYRDIWDFLHECDTGDVEVVDNIKKISRKRTLNGLIKFLKAPSSEELASFFKYDPQITIKLYENLFNATKESIHNRKVRNNMFIRIQNKIKHGMAVQEIPEGILIKDIKISPRNKQNRTTNIRHTTRRFILNLDTNMAERLVKTIESNCVAIQTLAFIIMHDLGENIQGIKGKKLTKKRTKFLTDSLKNYST